MDKVNPETVVVKDSKFGKGLFTTTDLPKKTILFKITGTPLTFKDTLKLGDGECYSLQVGIDKYIIPDHPFHLSNHSCDPNCGLTRNLEYFTLREVYKGEELCWDYSTSMLEKHWEMKCKCGSPLCRHIIQDFDLLPFNIQEKYLRMKIVLPFITEELYGLPTILRANNSKVANH
jgi:Proteins containing SET domain